MARIADFLEKLTSDEDFEKEFGESDESADKLMTKFGLKPAQKDLILNGTAKQIRKAVFEELGKDALVFRVKMH
jgi:hypothetical protein